MKGLGTFIGASAIFLVAVMILPVGCALVVKTGTLAVSNIFNQPFWLMLVEALAYCMWLQFSGIKKGEKT